MGVGVGVGREVGLRVGSWRDVGAGPRQELAEREVVEERVGRTKVGEWKAERSQGSLGLLE